MNPLNRFLTISFALFCAIAPIAACSSSGGGDAAAPPQTSQSAGITRRTFLNTAQMVSSSPPVSSLTGTAAMELDTATGRLAGGVTLSGSANTVVAVHINDGDAGSNGDPAVSLVETPAGSGRWTIPDTAAALSAALADRFKAAGLYVIVDTSANPGGEIRGQLLSFSENIQTIFDGHCVGCHGSAGAAGLALNKANSYGRLVNQPATQSSGVRVIPFDAAGSALYRRISGAGFAGALRMPPNGPYLSAADDGLLKAWINMGAIDDNGVSPNSAPQGAQFTGRAILNSQQTVSAALPASSATGTAVMTLDTATSRLTGTVALANLTNAASAVHINDGDAGSNGPLVVSLSETPVGSGTWTLPATALSAAQMDRFKAAGFYVSADTAANPGGEIRGQLLSYSENIQPIFSVNCAGCHYALGLANFTGLLLSPAESYANLVNKSATQSTGARVVPFDADNSALFSRISGTGFAAIVGPQMPPPGPAFSLLSSRDQNLIKAWINSGAMDDNGTVQSPQSVLARQFARSTFLNDKQVVTTPSVISTATGTASITLDTATSKLTGTVVLSNITATAVRINDGDAGSNGSQIVSLTETPAGSGVWTIPDTMAALTPLLMNRFIAAGFYVSVDTTANPSGEIRGQFLSYTGNVQPIFTIRCVQCHNSGLDLRQGQSYASLVNQPATQQTVAGTRVVPGDAAGSVLYQRVIGAGPTGFRMPFDGPPFLSQREENIIKTWIDMGAGNN